MSFTIAGLCFTGAHGAAVHHDLRLVALSYLIAVGGSFTALEMIERWRNAHGSAARFWQFASAEAFGSSVWSMHFIGILALQESFTISYAPGATFVSLLIAITAVAVGLEIVRGGTAWYRIGGAGVAVGLGVAAMHYVGMAALRFPGSLAYTPELWGLSLLVAIGAATCALWLALTLGKAWQRGLAALVMGCAICGMHYVGMAAAVFRIDPVTRIAAGMPSMLLAVMVAIVTLALTLCALVLVAVDRRLFASEMRGAAVLQSSYLKLEAANAELEQSREQLARKSRFFETTLENITHGIVMTDARRVIQVMNRRMNEIFDLPGTVQSGELDLFGLMRILWEHGEFGPHDGEFAVWLGPYAQAKHSLNRYEHRRPNGRIIEISWMAMAGGGEVRTYTDITQLKQAEEAMRAARDDAALAARAKSEFLAMMSHEIRSPLSGLVGVLDLLRESDLQPDQRRMAAMAHGSAGVLLAVLNDILDFSKIEAGAISLAPEPAQLPELVGQVVQPHLLAASRKGTRVAANLSPDLPEWALLDPLRLMQILNNLLSNAVKFTAAGDIEVNVAIVTAGAGAQLSFAVRDTGIGMRAETVAALFEPFVQADASTTRNFGGTGLGLCISKRLAELMGGHLGVTSVQGAGSTFTLLLPLVTASKPAAIVAAPFLALETLGGCFRVLVVDDDQTNRWITQRQIQLLGAQADTAEDGETALGMLHRCSYDLLLTDCHMPRMDGTALTRAVRADPNPALAGLPIIGLTADVTAGQRERCLEAGMTEVAIKPLSRQRLFSMVSLHLKAAPVPLVTAPEGAAQLSAFDDTIYRELFTPGDPDGEICLDDFLETAERLAGELATLLADNAEPWPRRGAFAATAHRLAGASASIGATRLAAAARGLEQIAESADAGRLRSGYADLRRELAAAQPAIAAFIDEWRLEAA